MGGPRESFGKGKQDTKEQSQSRDERGQECKVRLRRQRAPSIKGSVENKQTPKLFCSFKGCRSRAGFVKFQWITCNRGQAEVGRETQAERKHLETPTLSNLRNVCFLSKDIVSFVKQKPEEFDPSHRCSALSQDDPQSGEC